MNKNNVVHDSVLINVRVHKGERTKFSRCTATLNMLSVHMFKDVINSRCRSRSNFVEIIKTEWVIQDQSFVIQLQETNRGGGGGAF